MIRVSAQAQVEFKIRMQEWSAASSLSNEGRRVGLGVKIFHVSKIIDISITIVHSHKINLSNNKNLKQQTINKEKLKSTMVFDGLKKIYVYVLIPVYFASLAIASLWAYSRMQQIKKDKKT